MSCFEKERLAVNSEIFSDNSYFTNRYGRFTLVSSSHWL